MKRNLKTPALLFGMIAAGVFSSKGQSKPNLNAQLLQKDSVIFNAALKTCNISELQNVYAPEFQYEQDKGDGKTITSIGRDEFVDRIKNRCGRGGPAVRRETSEVSAFRVGTDRAIQNGIQRFFVAMPGQPEQLVETTRFSRTWKSADGDWLMTSELDYPAAAPAVAAVAKPQNQQHDPLYQLIAGLDEKMFTAYNNRDANQFMPYLSRDLEFYHDRGGLTNYVQNVALFKKTFSDTTHKMRRELVAGSLEVYPIGQYGALEVGVHKFYGTVNGKEQLEGTAKFADIWKNENGKWTITRVFSYDHE